MSPTQRALAELKKQGVTCQVVEKWNPYAKIRQDLFGCIDIVALMENSIFGIQVTSGSNHSQRILKIKAEPRLYSWLRHGGRLQVWSYSKKGKKGERKLWTLRKEEVTLDSFV